jgi:hypothetical protein
MANAKYWQLKQEHLFLSTLFLPTICALVLLRCLKQTNMPGMNNLLLLLIDGLDSKNFPPIKKSVVSFLGGQGKLMALLSAKR